MPGFQSAAAIAIKKEQESMPRLPCIKCKSQILPSAKFCSQCGAKQERTAAAAGEQQPTMQKRPSVAGTGARRSPSPQMKAGQEPLPTRTTSSSARPSSMHSGVAGGPKRSPSPQIRRSGGGLTGSLPAVHSASVESISSNSGNANLSSSNVNNTNNNNMMGSTTKGPRAPSTSKSSVPTPRAQIVAEDPKPLPAGRLRSSSTTIDERSSSGVGNGNTKPASRPVSRGASTGRSTGGAAGSRPSSSSRPPRESPTSTPPPLGSTVGGPKPTSTKSKGVKSSESAVDNFPKMPMASEMVNKKDIFMAKIDTFARKVFAAEDFESGKTAKLSPLEEPGALFAEADTRVFVRCRPILPHETEKTPVVSRAPGYKDCIMLAPQVSLAGGCTLSPYPLPVDATFPSTDTDDNVYSYLSELVELSLKGGSASVMCYGQTGSGKTFTTTGLLRNMASQIEVAIKAGKVAVTATFVELHHEGCRDLISLEREVNICEVGNKVELQKSQENSVGSAGEFLRLVETAVGNRSTKATLKNAGSSRSHMVIRLLVKDVDTPWANPGILCIADLAGSESNSDMKEHDKERVIETKFINSSLMTLKDCIRARGVAATSSKHVHIPYRQTSLTLILKDSFELVVKRPTKAAVIACVSPLFMDIRHTGNTVRYASMLFVSPKKRIVVADNPNDPNCWDREETLKRLSGFGGAGLTNPELVLPEGDGRALVLIAEADFIRRILESHPKFGEKKAQMVYTKVWKAVVDSRTKTRKDILKVNPAASRETTTTG